MIRYCFKEKEEKRYFITPFYLIIACNSFCRKWHFYVSFECLFNPFTLALAIFKMNPLLATYVDTMQNIFKKSAK